MSEKRKTINKNKKGKRKKATYSPHQTNFFFLHWWSPIKPISI